jgi:GTP-binding protein
VTRAARPPPPEIVATSFVAAAPRLSDLPVEGAGEIAFAGRSNVGKSSLMNALMGRKRLVRTSATPGCTRVIAMFRAVARDGAAFLLVDLPGYGYARRSLAERRSWGALCDGYLRRREALRVVVLLVDPRRALGGEEEQLCALLDARAVTSVVVATKIDKLPASRRRAVLARLAPGRPVVAVSAVTGEGVDALWQLLRKLAGTPADGEEALEQAQHDWAMLLPHAPSVAPFRGASGDPPAALPAPADGWWLTSRSPWPSVRALVGRTGASARAELLGIKEQFLAPPSFLRPGLVPCLSTLGS